MQVNGVSIVTTTYNEKENIAKLIQRIRSVLASFPHEIIVVDDNSPDDTYAVARQYADNALKKTKEGQTAGLLYGIKAAKYRVIITIDADIENPPEIIPDLLAEYEKSNDDILVASRESLPRLSEVIASKTLGQAFSVSDVYSNYRILRNECFKDAELELGETFGAELLLIAKKRGYKISDYKYAPPERRQHPRIGGRIRAEFRILCATIKVATRL
ncbi:MAG: glycosyltransferase [Thaumarchaeota archaeon]|nr:glycosyltransferase [Nitrososphaerota archaeon]MCL5318591.1 glycosyltransferase [Nitrososphaerota archaeon]